MMNLKQNTPSYPIYTVATVKIYLGKRRNEVDFSFNIRKYENPMRSWREGRKFIKTFK